MRWIIFSLLLLSVSAYSQESTQIKSNNQNQSSNTQQENSKQLPIIVNVNPPIKTDEEKREERAEAKHKAIIDDALAEFTGKLAIYTGNLANYTMLLFIATVIIAAGTLGLLYMGWRQSKDTKQAIGIAGTDLIVGRRAYFSIYEYFPVPWPSQDQFGDLEFIIVWKNVGQTVATDISVATYIEIANGVNPSLTCFDKFKPGEEEFFSVAPENSIRIISKTKLPRAQWNEINKGTMKAYLCGVMQYKDAFPETPLRHMTTCVEIIPDTSQETGVRFEAYKRYWQAD